MYDTFYRQCKVLYSSRMAMTIESMELKCIFVDVNTLLWTLIHCKYMHKNRWWIWFMMVSSLYSHAIFWDGVAIHSGISRSIFCIPVFRHIRRISISDWVFGRTPNKQSDVRTRPYSEQWKLSRQKKRERKKINELHEFIIRNKQLNLPSPPMTWLHTKHKLPKSWW